MTATGRLAIVASISAPAKSSYTYRPFLLLQQHAKGFASIYLIFIIYKTSKLRLYDRLLPTTNVGFAMLRHNDQWCGSDNLSRQPCDQKKLDHNGVSFSCRRMERCPSRSVRQPSDHFLGFTCPCRGIQDYLFYIALRSDVYPLFNITAIPRYQICRPCPSMVICNGVFPLSPAHYAAHLIFLFLFFAPYHINNVSLSTARCRGLRPDIFAYLIFLRSGIEWWLSILTGHINVCSNAN